MSTKLKKLLEKPLLEPMKVVFMNGMTCPQCGVPTLTLWGRENGRQVYRCCSCFGTTINPIPVDTGRKKRFGFLTTRRSGLITKEGELTDAEFLELEKLSMSQTKLKKT